MARTERYIDWEEVRAEYEADPTITNRDLAKRFGITGQAIGQRAKREGWVRVDPNASDVRKAIQKRADKKSADIRPVQSEVVPDTPATPSGQPSALGKEIAIEARASIIDRHRREVNLARNTIYSAVTANDFNKAKLAKITAETISIVQASERKAWGLDGTPTVNLRIIPQSGRDVND